MKRLAFLVTLLLPVVADAHVGSPDVTFEGQAGPYALLVSVRPPEVVPGVAEIFVQGQPDGPSIDRLELVPMPLSGPGAKFAPTADRATPIAGAVQSWSAHLWMMSTGAWQVKLTAHGAAGDGELRVPVPALPIRTKTMQAGLGAILLLLGLLLGAGVVSIVGASVREGQLSPGAQADGERKKRAGRAMIGAAIVVALAVWGGNAWWSSEADAYARYVYKPVQMDAVVDDKGLELTLRDPGWLKMRKLDDLVPDHDHLMHLFAVRVPAMDRVLHLHPEMLATAKLRAPAPAELEPGRWMLFGDIVHENGLPETAVATLEVSAHAPTPLGSDDATGRAPPLGAATTNEFPLESGGKVERVSAPTRADGKPSWLRFRVLEQDGQPTKDLELYMGMLGHAAVLRDDLSVFAHLHPSGSVPMASLMIAEREAGKVDPHAGHHMQMGTLPSEISFPYVFPRAGRYRVFVQLKRRGHIESAAFDVNVD